MKGFLRIIVLLSVLLVMFSASWASYYEEGNNGESWTTAYVIDSAQDFIDMSTRGEYDEQGKYYKLSADIDLSGQEFLSRMFSGHFDGQGHTITINALNKNVSYGVYDATLFRRITGSIRNLNVRGYAVLAGIAGTLGGNAENCSFIGTVSADAKNMNANIGGLFGEISMGAVAKNCNFSGDIRASFAADGWDFSAGGIASTVYVGTIESCTANIKVIWNLTDTRDVPNQYGYGSIGGIAGMVVSGDNTIKNCTSYAEISGDVYKFGGILGDKMYGDVELSGNKWAGNYPEVGSIYSGYVEVPDNTNDKDTANDNGNKTDNINDNGGTTTPSSSSGGCDFGVNASVMLVMVLAGMVLRTLRKH